jgi:hypothetical protein
LVSAYLATTIYGSVTLPFVIPSEAEGSAVRPGSRTNVCVTHRHFSPCVNCLQKRFCRMQSFPFQRDGDFQCLQVASFND